MHLDRLSKVTEQMKSTNLDQLIISDSVSIYYLTGISIHPGERLLVLLLDQHDQPKLFVNEMFELTDLDIPVHYFKDTQCPVALLASHIRDTGILGIDKNWPARFLLILQNIKKDVSFVNGSMAIDSVRLCKSDTEIDLMIKASQLNDQAMDQIQSLILSDRSEVEMIDALKDIYKHIGADGLSFDPIICYGANAAEPHHTCDKSKVKPGDSVIIDIGCVKDGYCSDMTRTVFYKSVSDEAAKVYQIVLEANLNAIRHVKPGALFSEIDRAARSVIEEAGYGDHFIHRTGHSIGLEVHDFGDVSATNHDVLKPGMIFSIEPGVYLKNKFGIRIEDLVLVTDDGYQVLNQYDKSLKIIG